MIIITLAVLMLLIIGGCALNGQLPDGDSTEDSYSQISQDDDMPGSPSDCITNENMVFDYYEGTVATTEENEYTEYVLYKYTDEQMVLALYRKQGDVAETMDYCLVLASILDDCMDLVRKYKMHKWSGGPGLEGRKYVIKFLDDGIIKRVSSEDMPEDGQEAFNAIRKVLSEEWNKNSITEEG